MSRSPVPVFKNGGIFYARYHLKDPVTGKDINKRLSLGTTNHYEALRRAPIVMGCGMSWAEYQRNSPSLSPKRSIITNLLEGHNIVPPIVEPEPVLGEAVRALLDELLTNGQAKYNPATGEWCMYVTPPAEAQRDPASIFNYMSQLLHTPPIPNDTEDIRAFYRDVIRELYTDKVRAENFERIWLDFLFNVKKVKSWAQIDEPLLSAFREWRLSTPIKCGKKPGKKPSNETVNRHEEYLCRSFEKAVRKGKMKYNPLDDKAQLIHEPPVQQALTADELLKVLGDEEFDRDYLGVGKKKVLLPFKLRDFYLVLFLASKRCKEITTLNIGAANYGGHYVFYKDHKNSRRANYISRKAFYLPPQLEALLKRVAGTRNPDEYFFNVPAEMRRKSERVGELNGSYMNELFKDVCKKYTSKDVHLHNLRHTANRIMADAGLPEADRDYALGHYNPKTVLSHYESKDDEYVGKYLSGLTKPGIEALCKAVEHLM